MESGRGNLQTIEISPFEKGGLRGIFMVKNILYQIPLNLPLQKGEADRKRIASLRLHSCCKHKRSQ